MKKKNITLSVKLFIREIEKIEEERNEYEVIDFNECLDDAFAILKDYVEENEEDVEGWIDWIQSMLGCYYLIDHIGATREEYVSFDFLDCED